MPPAKRPVPTPPTPIDLMADLRADFGGDDAPERGPEPLGDVGPPESTSNPAGDAEGLFLVTEQDRDAHRAMVIAAWHADTVALGFLHRGGQCGCRYITNLALDAVLPVQANADAST